MIRGQIHKVSFFALAFLERKSSWLFESWIFSSMLFRKVWLLDQSVHFHFQFLKGQSSFAPWRLHCQAKVKVKTKRGERNVFSKVEYNPISSIVTRTYVELEGQMILRLSKVSASAAWPQITGIKSRASHHYQPSNYQPSNCTTSLPTTATNLPTVLSAYQQCTPFHISPPRTQTDQFVGNALSDSNEGSFKEVLGQDE